MLVLRFKQALSKLYRSVQCHAQAGLQCLHMGRMRNIAVAVDVIVIVRHQHHQMTQMRRKTVETMICIHKSCVTKLPPHTYQNDLSLIQMKIIDVYH